MERKIIYSFQPGPAQLFPEVEHWIQVALRDGLLSRYHRDPVWKRLFAEAQTALADYLGLPNDWTVAFASSATEIWQILADAAADLSSLHFIQGEFGRRWLYFQKSLSPFAKAIEVEPHVPWEEQVDKASEKYRTVRYIGVVHVETSIGAWIPTLDRLRQAFPEAFIAIDATSSLGGLRLPWEAIDLAFASVQKCLGLPPGMGVLLISPKVSEYFKAMPRSRYNALGHLVQMAQSHEPVHTPNLLLIYLLARVLPQRLPLLQVEKELLMRAERLYDEVKQRGFEVSMPPLYRAPTVLALKWKNPEEALTIRQRAESAGLYLGWGHGEHRDTWFRIANFPAIPDAAYDKLLEVLCS
ncbi:MAG: aminotransferase class V-fold PLP-dependent enzyme [Bacteroidia bacterium]|nr:aminotransferase class V-fold PLP-dependent enzyme [Bacteroidia bacterium]